MSGMADGTDMDDRPGTRIQLQKRGVERDPFAYPRWNAAFGAQRAVVLPGEVTASAARWPMLRDLLVTDVGRYSRAWQHRCPRPDGAVGAIFIYCRRGRGFFEMDGTRRVIEPGMLLVVPPGVPHAYGADVADAWSIDWLHAQGERVHYYLEELGLTRASPVLHVGRLPGFKQLITESLVTLESSLNEAHLLHAAQGLGYFLSRRLVELQEERTLPDLARERVLATVEYMQTHVHLPLEVAALCERAGLSRSRYFSLFKHEVGVAPLEFFTRMKIDRARELLVRTNQSATRIATALGYEDPLYFSKVFKAKTGFSPIRYRHRFRESR